MAGLTPVPEVRNRDERALLLGDTLHTVGQPIEPESRSMWDVGPVAAGIHGPPPVGDPFAPAHFPALAFDRLITVEKLRKFSWAP